MSKKAVLDSQDRQVVIIGSVVTALLVAAFCAFGVGDTLVTAAIISFIAACTGKKKR